MCKIECRQKKVKPSFCLINQINHTNAHFDKYCWCWSMDNQFVMPLVMVWKSKDPFHSKQISCNDDSSFSPKWIIGIFQHIMDLTIEYWKSGDNAHCTHWVYYLVSPFVNINSDNNSLLLFFFPSFNSPLAWMAQLPLLLSLPIFNQLPSTLLTRYLKNNAKQHWINWNIFYPKMKIPFGWIQFIILICFSFSTVFIYFMRLNIVQIDLSFSQLFFYFLVSNALNALNAFKRAIRYLFK